MSSGTVNMEISSILHKYFPCCIKDLFELKDLSQIWQVLQATIMSSLLTDSIMFANSYITSDCIKITGVIINMLIPCNHNQYLIPWDWKLGHEVVPLIKSYLLCCESLYREGQIFILKVAMGFSVTWIFNLGFIII